MKNQLPLTLLLFVLTTPSVFAASSHSNDHAAKVIVPTTIQATPTEVITPTGTSSLIGDQSVTPTPTSSDPSLQTRHQKSTIGNGSSVTSSSTLTSTSSPSPTPTPSCPANGVYLNHGAYVSCVAHEHLGGKAVSEAARSNIGKKNQEPTPPLTSPLTSAAVSGMFAPLHVVQSFFTAGIDTVVQFFRHLFSK